MNASQPRFFQRVVVPATSAYSLRATSISLVALFSVLLHFLGAPALAINQVGQRVLLSGTAILPLFALIWAAHRFDYRSDKTRAGVVLAAYFVGGALRGVWVADCLSLFHLETTLSVWAIVATSAVTFFMSAAITAYFYASWSRHLDAVTDLRLRNQQLTEALEQIEREAHSEAKQQTVAIADHIVAELSEIQFSPLDHQLSELKLLLDQNVRPMSRSYASDVRGWQPNLADTDSSLHRLRVGSIDLLQNLPSPWLAITFSVAIFPNAYYLFGFGTAMLLILLSSVTAVPAFYFAYWFLRKVLPKVRPSRRLVVLPLVVVLGSSLPALSSVLALSNTPDQMHYVVAALSTYTLFISFLAVAGALFADLKTKEAELLLAEQRLQWAIARTNLLAWFNRGEIARLLHGPIQNSLHATLIRLQERKADDAVAAIIENLKSRITDMTKSLQNKQVSKALITQNLEEAAAIWAGIAAINTDVSAPALEVLEADVAVSTIVYDLISEFCSNAVRHGGATEIFIGCEATPTKVALMMRDNGVKSKPSQTPGLGSKLMQACSIKLTLATEGATNVTLVELPTIAGFESLKL